MHGIPVTVGDLQDVWAHLNTFGNIASELVVLPPPPAISTHSNLAQEFELANALFYMYRSVKGFNGARFKRKHALPARCVQIYRFFT